MLKQLSFIMSKTIVNIPNFEGFYCSWIDEEINHIARSEAEYYAEDYDLSEDKQQEIEESYCTQNYDKLEIEINKVIKEGKLTPKAIIPVDLFGLPARYRLIKEIAKEYDLFILEDAAQGFGGSIRNKKAGSYGHVSATSFFPAKPLGCYGDGGAIFTDDESGKIKATELIKNERINLRLAINAVGGESALRIMSLLSEGGTHITYGATVSYTHLTLPTKRIV